MDLLQGNVMKIGGQTDLNRTELRTDATKVSSPRDTKEAPGVSPAGLSVSISEAAQLELQKAPFDQARVDEIREQIANGTFTVNAAAVADALMGSTPKR